MVVPHQLEAGLLRDPASHSRCVPEKPKQGLEQACMRPSHCSNSTRDVVAALVPRTNEWTGAMWFHTQWCMARA